MLFGNAHPLWEPHDELWSRTDADILIEDEKTLKLNFDRPIPVFASKTLRDGGESSFLNSSIAMRTS
jgi:hypothetical protein